MPLTDTDINPGQHNKMKKVLFCLFFALVLFGCVSIYICIAIAFPCDTSETLCEILANKDSKIILYKRSGNATVAFHYVLYENEVNSDKIIYEEGTWGVTYTIKKNATGEIIDQDGNPVKGMNFFSTLYYLISSANLKTC